MACVILTRQIEVIDGKKDNIIIPSLRMQSKGDAEKKEAGT